MKSVEVLRFHRELQLQHAELQHFNTFPYLQAQIIVICVKVPTAINYGSPLKVAVLQHIEHQHFNTHT